MYVDWDYYKIFYYVAKYQNFTKAARVLGSNQPNITHTMNKLEDQLHCVLFIRSNRGVTLTPEGENLYARISSAAVQIQDAEEELSASASLSHGAISISASGSRAARCSAAASTAGALRRVWSQASRSPPSASVMNCCAAMNTCGSARRKR